MTSALLQLQLQLGVHEWHMHSLCGSSCTPSHTHRSLGFVLVSDSNEPTGQGGKRPPRTPQAACMSPGSQSRTLTHNHSSCWIIQSKHWPTFKVGNMLDWRPGVESGMEANGGRSRGRTQPWWAPETSGWWRRKGRACGDRVTSSQHGPPRELWSDPARRRLSVRGLQLSANVIKTGRHRNTAGSPVLEASLQEECSSQEWGLTQVSHHQSAASTPFLPRAHAPLHSCCFPPFVWMHFIFRLKLKAQQADTLVAKLLLCVVFV